METQLVNIAKTRTQMEYLMFDLDCLWLLREPRQTWDVVKQEIARQIESGNKLICQGKEAVISIQELAEVLQHEQRGSTFGISMSRNAEVIKGAKAAIKQLNFSNNPVRIDAEKLRQIRNDLKLTQTDFGQYLGGSPLRTVQDWEAGKAKIPPSVIEVLRLKGQL